MVEAIANIYIVLHRIVLRIFQYFCDLSRRFISKVLGQ